MRLTSDRDFLFTVSVFHDEIDGIGYFLEIETCRVGYIPVGLVDLDKYYTRRAIESVIEYSRREESIVRIHGLPEKDVFDQQMIFMKIEDLERVVGKDISRYQDIANPSPLKLLKPVRGLDQLLLMLFRARQNKHLKNKMIAIGIRQDVAMVKD